MRDALKQIGRPDILENINNHLTKLREPKQEKNDLKKSVFELEELKKREIDLLHDKLTKYFERIKSNQNQPQQQVHFKFSFLKLD